jgi:hypothetical protein
MKAYGSIIGESDPTWFEFNIEDTKNRPVSYEYVEVEVEEPQPDGTMRSIRVLGQVKTITSRHPFYDERCLATCTMRGGGTRCGGLGARRCRGAQSTEPRMRFCSASSPSTRARYL